MKKKVLIIVPSNKGTIASCSLNIYAALRKVESIVIKCVVIHKYSDGFKEFEDCEWCVDYVSSGIQRLSPSCNREAIRLVEEYPGKWENTEKEILLTIPFKLPATE